MACLVQHPPKCRVIQNPFPHTNNNDIVRFGSASAIGGQYLFIHGGSSGLMDQQKCINKILGQKLSSNINIFDDLCLLDLVSLEWTQLDGTPHSNNMSKDLSNATFVEEITHNTLKNPPGPDPRFCHSIVYLKQKLYLFGGVSRSSKNTIEILDDLWEFDLVSRNWKLLELHTSCGRYNSSLLVINDASSIFTPSPTQNNLHCEDCLVIVGGQTINGPSTNVFGYVLSTKSLVDQACCSLMQSLDTHSFILSFSSRGKCSINDALLYFSSATNVLQVWSSHHKGSEAVHSKTLRIPISKDLKKLQGFFVCENTLLITGYDQQGNFLPLLVNISSGSYSKLITKFPMYEVGQHLILLVQYWQSRGKLVLLTTPGSNKNLWNSVMFSLSSSILQFGESKYCPHQQDNFKKLKEEYKRSVLSDSSLEMVPLSDAGKFAENDSSFVRFEYEKENDNEDEANRKTDLEFENYVKYLVPDSKPIYGTANLTAPFSSPAVALGRTVFQHYLTPKNDSLSDFQMIGYDEEFVPITLKVLLSRWGTHFQSILGVAYAKTLKLLTEKLIAEEADNSKRSIVSRVSTATLGHRISSIASSLENDANIDDALMEEEILELFKSPLTFTLLTRPGNEKTIRKYSSSSYASSMTGIPRPATADSSNAAHTPSIEISPSRSSTIKPTRDPANAATTHLSQVKSAFSHKTTSPQSSLSEFINYPGISSRKNSVISNNSSTSSASDSLIDSRLKYDLSGSSPSHNFLGPLPNALRRPSAISTKSPPLALSDENRSSGSSGSITVPQASPIPEFAPPEVPVSPISKPKVSRTSELPPTSAKTPVVFKYSDKIRYKDHGLMEESLPPKPHHPSVNILQSFGSNPFREASWAGTSEARIMKTIIDEYKRKLESDGNANKAGAGRDPSSQKSSHFLLEPSLIPRTLYLPFHSSVIRSLSEFFLTGQLNGKLSIAPIVTDLYIAASQYDIQLLGDLCSEVLFAVVKKKEQSVMNYIEFLDCELNELEKKNQDEAQTGELKSLHKTFNDKFWDFRSMVSGNFKGDHSFYIARALAKYNRLLRSKKLEKSKSLDDGDEHQSFTDEEAAKEKEDVFVDDSEDEGYDTDEYDNLSFGICDTQYPAEKHKEVAGKRYLSFNIEDINQGIRIPSNELIATIYETAGLVMDNLLLMRSMYLLHIIELVESMKSPIELKIKADYAAMAAREEAETKKRQLELKKIHFEQEAKEKERKLQEKLKLQEMEKLSVAKECIREEQYKRQQSRKVAFDEQPTKNRSSEYSVGNKISTSNLEIAMDANSSKASLGSTRDNNGMLGLQRVKSGPSCGGSVQPTVRSSTDSISDPVSKTESKDYFSDSEGGGTIPHGMHHNHFAKLKIFAHGHSLRSSRTEPSNFSNYVKHNLRSLSVADMDQPIHEEKSHQNRSSPPPAAAAPEQRSQRHPDFSRVLKFHKSILSIDKHTSDTNLEVEVSTGEPQECYSDLFNNPKNKAMDGPVVGPEPPQSSQKNRQNSVAYSMLTASTAVNESSGFAPSLGNGSFLSETSTLTDLSISATQSTTSVVNEHPHRRHRPRFGLLHGHQKHSQLGESEQK
ncbi:Mds3 protein [Saccharomycopsis crataegensis]|uniref:Mds3 protein n=1 Tax=Saccharomycopsis crataegensis TaxID=43959 RepID=A0AAV5QF07_9ASCO|nr:Mds3 protein [Saccharomycopsis crataegensis]